MKLPAFQFYPADWRKDPGVQALSFHDRGVWFEIICLMHESEERGKLLLGGQAMPDAALARLLGLDKQNLTNTISTLITYGVATRCETSGALMSRRMVRDEKIRKIRKEAGKKGGNPALLNQKANQKPKTEDKQNPTPSSSSSPSGNLVSSQSAGARPSQAECRAYARSAPVPISEDCAVAFHDTQEAGGWIMKSGHPIADWRAALRRYASAWNENLKSRASPPAKHRDDKAQAEYPEPPKTKLPRL